MRGDDLRTQQCLSVSHMLLLFKSSLWPSTLIHDSSWLPSIYVRQCRLCWGKHCPVCLIVTQQVSDCNCHWLSSSVLGLTLFVFLVVHPYKPSEIWIHCLGRGPMEMLQTLSHTQGWADKSLLVRGQRLRSIGVMSQILLRVQYFIW